MPRTANSGSFKTVPLANRFWNKVAKTDGCWIWTAGKSEDGYGRIRVDNRRLSAHIVAYYLKFGEWPPFGYECDHTCKNRACVRWGRGHLESITESEHSVRTALTHRNRDKKECIRGHSRWAFTKDNRRYCMDCNLLRAKGVIGARL